MLQITYVLRQYCGTHTYYIYVIIQLYYRSICALSSVDTSHESCIDEFINQHRIVPSNRISRAIWISLEYNDYSLITKIVKSYQDKRMFIHDLSLDSINMFNDFFTLLFQYFYRTSSASITRKKLSAIN